MIDPRRAGSAVVKHSLAIAGHRTSVSLEQAFWTALKAIAVGSDRSISEVVAAIDRDRGAANLSSAIRVAVLEHVTAGRAKQGLSQDAADKTSGGLTSGPISSTR